MPSNNHNNMFRTVRKVLVMVNIFVAGAIVDHTYTHMSSYMPISLQKKSGDDANQHHHKNITNHSLYGIGGDEPERQLDIEAQRTEDGTKVSQAEDPPVIPAAAPPADTQTTPPANSPTELPVVPETSPPTVAATTEPPFKLTAAVPDLPPPNDPNNQVANPIPIDEMSVLEYRACCGLGHRLVRMALAYNAAKRLRFRLEPKWGQCGEGAEAVDIFDNLFRPESPYELAYVNSTNQRIVAGNEVTGYYATRRGGCHAEQIATDNELYQSLMTRYSKKDKLDDFVKEHFQGKLAFGIHVRAGNGETGDFSNKNRAIAVSPEEYTGNVTQRIVSFLEKTRVAQPDLPPPVLYIATDTPSYIELFRKQMFGIMPVVDWEQDHEEPGKGVFLGQHGQHQDAIDKETCLKKWHDMVSDQMLLSSTDVVIAGKYSSFSQSMPLSISLGRINKKIPQAFCEMKELHEDLHCHENFMGWCANTKHQLVQKTLNRETGWEEFLTNYKIPHR